MKAIQAVKALELLAESIGLKVRRETGNFRGGLCFIKAEEMILLNKRHPAEAHLSILAECLYQHKDTILQTALKPALRAILEKNWLQKEVQIESFE